MSIIKAFFKWALFPLLVVVMGLYWFFVWLWDDDL